MNLNCIVTALTTLIAAAGIAVSDANGTEVLEVTMTASVEGTLIDEGAAIDTVSETHTVHAPLPYTSTQTIPNWTFPWALGEPSRGVFGTIALETPGHHATYQLFGRTYDEVQVGPSAKHEGFIKQGTDPTTVGWDVTMTTEWAVRLLIRPILDGEPMSQSLELLNDVGAHQFGYQKNSLLRSWEMEGPDGTLASESPSTGPGSFTINELEALTPGEYVLRSRLETRYWAEENLSPGWFDEGGKHGLYALSYLSLTHVVPEPAGMGISLIVVAATRRTARKAVPGPPSNGAHA
jgi:hypothetical protein